ncbi:PepSY domain-containing protein [Halioxenophilus aromaticivorans]|uniref:PepSY domain-containing protein n=1 Tax=Halioxenophilus aromaticivorans TaxID=1306992 RepID=A0AAV3U548_9ALTE
MLQFRCLLIWLLAHPVLADDTAGGDNQSDTTKPELATDAQEDTTLKRGPTGKLDPTERLITPVTGWIENQAHKSRLLNPDNSLKTPAERQQNNSNLRQAIVAAQELYPGTVLSAERVIVDKNNIYKIKILSPSGTIREIEIEGTSLALGKEK